MMDRMQLLRTFAQQSEWYSTLKSAGLLDEEALQHIDDVPEKAIVLQFGKAWFELVTMENCHKLDWTVVIRDGTDRTYSIPWSICLLCKPYRVYYNDIAGTYGYMDFELRLESNGRCFKWGLAEHDVEPFYVSPCANLPAVMDMFDAQLHFQKYELDTGYLSDELEGTDVGA